MSAINYDPKNIILTEKSNLQLKIARMNRIRRVFLFITLLLSTGLVLFISPEERWVVIPILVAFCATLYLLLTLWKREGMLPIFNIGMIYTTAVTLYAVFPLISFLLTGLRVSSTTDWRLAVYQPTPEKMGVFAWRYILYLLVFVAVYLSITRGNFGKRSGVQAPDRETIVVVILLFVFLAGYFGLLKVAYGYEINQSYATLLSFRQVKLPNFLRQITQNLAGIIIILKMIILAALILNWKKWRFIIFFWLTIETILTVLRLGARSEAVYLLMAAVLLYHLLVKPIKLNILIPVALVGYLGFTMVGVYRANRGMHPDLLNRDWVENSFVVPGEFQTSFGTAYDLYQRKKMGMRIPWQVYLSEPLMLVPSQLLPFDKIDPAEWYVSVLGISLPQGMGLTFGAIAQAVIGFDWIQVALEGFIVGIIYAYIHRWYLKYSSHFWVTILYLLLCIWSYLTFRNLTFYLVYYLVYRVAPTFLIIYLGKHLLRR